MTTEEFWEKYINEDILEIFDITCDFFSKELPPDFIENYDVGEVLLETRGHQERAKNFENVLRFTEIIQTKQPGLYQEYFQYFDDFLVDYYCFQQDKLKVKESFSNFIEDPLPDYDSYLSAFKKMLYYRHTELLEQAISDNYEAVHKSDDLIAGADYELELCKFHILLQDIYEKQIFDRKSFSAELLIFNFEISDDILAVLETGVLKPQIDAGEFKDKFAHDYSKSILLIELYFLCYMYEEKGFEFYLSGNIWNIMLNFWNINNSQETADSYFKIELPVFEKYLESFVSNFLFQNTSEMAAGLWGSVYIYEFFRKYHLISEKEFDDFIEVSRELKGKVIGQFTPDLWNLNFVHHWEKPDCISNEEFIQEKKIFEKSISFEPKKFTRLRSEIAEELSEIGELSDYIIEGGKTKEIGLLDLFPGIPEDILENNDNHNNYINEPITKEKKVGRNDPCPCGSGKKYKKCCGKN